VVANTGPAVPPAEIERLLRPFQRLAENRGGEIGEQGLGLGLGLSIAYAIAMVHGATLAVRARSGGGLEITVSFPASGLTPIGAQPAGASAMAQAGGSPPPGRRV
jgi:signal transduction histidine kinase